MPMILALPPDVKPEKDTTMIDTTRLVAWLQGIAHDLRAALRTWRDCRDMRRGHCPDALPF